MKKIFSTIIAIISLIALHAITTYASSGYNRVVAVPKGAEMVRGESTISRTCKYSYVTVNVKSVYPVDGKNDNYTKCKTQLRKSFRVNEVISQTYTLKEGKSINIHIYEGYLNEVFVDLFFAGNNPDYAAEILYNYYGN